jgi:hypothetical protein
VLALGASGFFVLLAARWVGTRPHPERHEYAAARPRLAAENLERAAVALVDSAPPESAAPGARWSRTRGVARHRPSRARTRRSCTPCAWAPAASACSRAVSIPMIDLHGPRKGLP